MNDAILGQKLKEGLEAVKVISGDDKKKDTIPDHNVRIKYLDMAFKLKNAYPAEKHKIEEERKVIVIGAKEKGNATERLFFEINNLVEKRIKLKGKYKEFIDGDGNDQRSEAQKLADRLIALRKEN